MARKPAPAAPDPAVLEDHTPPTEGVEIVLSADDGGEVEVDLAPAAPAAAAQAAPAAPVVEKKPEEDNPLKAALDAQSRAEELQRAAQRERDDAVRQARERDEELARERGGRQDAEYNSILTAIAAEESALDKAEGDYASAANAGDWGAAAKAQRIIGTASARLDRLNDGKQNFDSQREVDKTKPAPERAAPQKPGFEQSIAAMPEVAKTWLRKHPEFMNDTALNQKIQAAHGAIVTLDGVEAFSPAYFDALDTRFGFKAPAPAAPATPAAPQHQRRSMPLTAPVSRDVPSASGERPDSDTRMTLSAEERLIARTSFGPVDGKDLTNEQKERLYALNKRKLHKQRANGEYRQTTEQTG